ncbi:MAG: metallophosphoesterase [Bacteroidetes bacterium]|nr:metallophosphoesterase [Bacteroidota bacterium]
MYLENLSFLQDAFLNKKQSKNTIVVTHHVPTFLNYPEKYKGDVLNEAFAVELFDFIEKSTPDYWIFGHNHANIPSFKIGNTQLLTNQLGYIKHSEHSQFSFSAVIQA